MTRYETPEDRAREHAAADETREAWRCGVWVRPPGARIDWELFDGITADAEYKTRRFALGYWDDVLIGFTDKWDALLAAWPAFVIVRFDDGLRWAHAHESNVSRMAAGGREDRPGYIRPCVYFRNDVWQPIERRP